MKFQGHSVKVPIIAQRYLSSEKEQKEIIKALNNNHISPSKKTSFNIHQSQENTYDITFDSNN